MPKQVYTWGKVKPGDIISFRYKGKNSTGKLTTILVLNPKIQLHKERGKTDFYLVGLKLESQGVIPHIRNKREMVELLERIGELQVVDAKNEIYRVDIKNVGPRGAKQATYQKLKKHIERHSVYRTYDYREARRSQVFLEPIVLPKELREVLNAT
jgi:hypothetical protein